MGRRKHKINAIKSPSCSVCQVSSSSLSWSIPRCSSCSVLSRPTICDACFHRYILTTISRDIASRVICPEKNCYAELTKEIIRAALAPFGYQNLWDEYISKLNWCGTSERWIKSFTVKCPGCLVPIEKNGGCDHMILTKIAFIFLHIVTLVLVQGKMNLFGGNPFGGGFSPQFSGSFPQQGFGQFGGGFFNGGFPFQGGNTFPSGSQFPPPSDYSFASGFGGQYGQGSGFNSGFGGQYGQGSGFPTAYGGQFRQGSGFPPGPSGFGYTQPGYGPPFSSGQQSAFGNPNYSGSGPYDPRRARHSSRHRSTSGRRRSTSSRRRSSSRHRRSSSSSDSSDDEPYHRGQPVGNFDDGYVNIPSYPNIQPLAQQNGSSMIPSRRPLW